MRRRGAPRWRLPEPASAGVLIGAGSLEGMHPALPEEPSDDDVWLSADEVGEFRQGSALSQWALARYLVGRAIAESVSRTLLVIAVLVLALAVACQWGLHLTFVTVLLVIVAAVVLLLRWVLRTVLRKLTAADRYGPIEARLRALVSDTHGDVLRELRRAGLPSHTLTLPLLALRLAGKRRAETLARMRSVEIGRAVPQARLDELHMLLREAAGRPSGPGPVNR
jgi:hypothetical protein